MEKIINPCSTKDGQVFCKIQFADGKLSISGVIGPKANGDSRGACGQINMDFVKYYPDPVFNEGWNADLFAQFLAVWDRWHLNDMRPGCEHQRNWNTKALVNTTSYTWGPAFHDLRRRVENGEATAIEYGEYQEMKTRVYAVTIGLNTPKCETPEVAELLAGRWLEVSKAETKRAGWVSIAEHPEGLLSKPCPVCGYKYGSAWNKEEVPSDVIAFLESLLGSLRTPAWL